MSALMAAIGIAFAYFVSLPGALHFLTGMDLKNIQAMLTVDSYLTFVMTYLLGAALLFQIPLLLTITNNMTPLKPKKLMKMQRYVIVAAFIIAAIISPTPDIMNQLLLALPVIVMYQVGVLLVWLQNRGRAKHAKKEAALPTFTIKPMPATPEPVMQSFVTPAATVVPAKKTAVVRKVSMDGFAPVRSQSISKPTPHAAQPQHTPSMQGISARPRPSFAQPRRPQPVRPVTPAVSRSLQVPARSVDGFMLHRPHQIAGSS
jgi:hypothetical protein